MGAVSLKNTARTKVLCVVATVAGGLFFVN
eukprot:COSAG06_NODE_67860_length_251_cov_0.190789_2_plen_29_part_01